MKIETVELKKMEVVETNGEFEQKFSDARKVPCVLTNYAMKKGKDMGVINSSLVADLLKLEGVANSNTSKPKSKESIKEALNQLDEVTMQKTIYLGCIGANKDFDLDFDSFLEQYHLPFEVTVDIYLKLVQGAIIRDPNQFAKGFKDSTKIGKKD